MKYRDLAWAIRYYNEDLEKDKRDNRNSAALDSAFERFCNRLRDIDIFKEIK